MGLQIGDQVGDYQILGVLGVGGMGSVYRVRNLISERIEAMKVLLPNLRDVPELEERFLREIKVQARLDHPNITALRTAFRAGNQLLMVMELVEGSSLDEVIKKGAIPVPDAVNYGCQMLDALTYAHSVGVIHRDLKPPNMILTPAGVVKLTDFGIARDKKESKLTRTGVALGSLYYMAPEQIQGKETDARSDVYSLAVTLYQFLTGELPFQGDSEYAVMTAHLMQNPKPPVGVNPQIPHALSEIILKALAKDPVLRFQTAGEFRTMLAGYQKVTGFNAPPIPPGTAIRPVEKRGKRWVFVAAGLVVALTIAGAIVSNRWETPASQGGLPVAAVQPVEPAAAGPAVTQEPVASPPPTAQSAPAKSTAQRQGRPQPASGVAQPATQSSLQQQKPATQPPPPAASPQPVPVAEEKPAVVAQAQPPPVQVVEKPVAQPQIAQPPAAPRDAAQEEWDRVSGSRDTVILEAFRRRFPGSALAAAAGKRIEEIDWTQARTSRDPQRLRAFHDKHPGSPFASQAAAEADRMEREAGSRALLALLAQYSAAFERQDASSIKSLRPSLAPDDLRRIEDMFRQTRSVQLKLEPRGDPQIQANRATISCRQTQTIQMRNGDRPPPASHNVTVTFIRTGSSWVIESIQ